MQQIFRHALTVKEENGRYCPARFTQQQLQALEKLHPKFKNFARCAAGVSLEFYTDAPEISFAYQYSPPLYTHIGGFDIYENGVMHKNIQLPKAPGAAVLTYTKESAGETHLEIFLPHNAEMVLWDFKLGNYRTVVPEQRKMILWYGDSITQSAYIHTPSLSYVDMVSRALSADYLNRGIGSLFYDASVLDENDPVKPDIIIVELGANDMVRHNGGEVVTADGVVQYCTGEDIPMLIANAQKYLERLMAIYPKAKIYVQSLLYSGVERTPAQMKAQILYGKALEDLVKRLGLNYIGAAAMMPRIPEVFAPDFVHPNALGNVYIASALERILSGE